MVDEVLQTKPMTQFGDFAELTGSGHILGSNSENSNLLPVAVE